RRQPGGDRRDHFLVDGRVGLAEQASALRVSDDDVLGARLPEHAGRDFTGECAVALEVEVLSGDADVGVARRFGHRVHGSEGRRHDDLDVGDVLDDEPQLLDEEDRFLNGLEHLPVASDEWDSHLSVRAATPGSVSPARNSSDAPPPVEIWVMRSATFAFFTAAIESPPPMIVVPFTAATARATAFVPAANASTS